VAATTPLAATPISWVISSLLRCWVVPTCRIVIRERKIGLENQLTDHERGGGEANLKVYHGSRHGPWWHDHAVSLPWGALDLYLLACGTVQQRRPRVREEQALASLATDFDDSLGWGS